MKQNTLRQNSVTFGNAQNSKEPLLSKSQRSPRNSAQGSLQQGFSSRELYGNKNSILNESMKRQDISITGGEARDTKEIDFIEMFSDYRKRTEFNMPHTAQQTEDVIFVSQNRLVALEYVFYSSQNENKYFNLEDPKKPTEKDETSQKVYIKQILEDGVKSKYMCSKWDFSKGFVEDPKIFQKSSEPEFHKLQGGCFVEAYISIWKINNKGHLVKRDQISFDLGQNFKPTKYGQMQLFLSPDKSIVTLGLVNDLNNNSNASNIQSNGKNNGQNNLFSDDGDSANLTEEEDQKDALSIKSWIVDKNFLREIDVSKELEQQLKCSLKGTLNEINYVGLKNKYVMLSQSCKYSSDEFYQKLFTIFDRKTGQKIFEISNYQANKLFQEKLGEHFENNYGVQNIQFMSMLARDPSADIENELGPVNQCDNQSILTFPSPIKTPDDESYQESYNGEQSERQYDNFSAMGKASINNPYPEDQMHGILSLIFFFVSSVSQNKDTNKTAMTFVEIDLIKLVIEIRNAEKTAFKPWHTRNYNSNQELIFNIMEKAALKFANFENQKEDFFELPRQWFFKDQDESKFWYNNIEIGTTKFFNHVGILNKQEKFYLAFELKDQKCDQNRGDQSDQQDQSNLMASYHVQGNSVCNIIRNQQTKRFLYLTERTKAAQGGGCKAICFYHKNMKQSISFLNDHIHACQDVQTQEYSYKKEIIKANTMANLKLINKNDIKKLENRYLLQSCSISELNQEIYLNTETAKMKDNEQDIKNVFRKSISQRVSANFPLLAYNLGLNKVLIQDTQGEQLAYLFKLPKGQKFVDFVEFNHFKDLDFNTHNFKRCLREIQLEMCSSFVFLTLHEQEKILRLNILLVNPYLHDFKVAHFQSNKCFMQLNDSDQTIKNFIFCSENNKTESGSQVKLITQYSSSFVIRKFKEVKDFKDQKVSLSEDEQDDEMLNDKEDEDNNAVGRQKDSEKNQVYKLEPIPMILTQSRYIYYVTCVENFFIVNQMDLKKDNLGNHKHVFEKRLKKIKCFGLLESSINQFYFIDEHKNITLLKQNEDTMALIESGQLFIKDHEKPAFNISPFEMLILDHKYLIHECRIFYLTDYPITKSMKSSVILNMEDLSYIEDIHEDLKLEHLPTFLKSMTTKSIKSFDSMNLPNQAKSFTFGPIKFRGSDQFGIIYKSSQTRDFTCRVYQIPDSSVISLQNYNHHINVNSSFSTFFRKSEKESLILLKQDNSFAIFDDTGVFQCMVKTKYISGNADSTMRTTHVCKPCHDHIRQKLLAISNNINFFLFADFAINKLVLYKLCPVKRMNITEIQQTVKETKISIKKEGQISRATFRKIKDISFEFQPVHIVDVESTQLFKEFTQDIKLIQENKVKVKITDKGDIQFLSHNYYKQNNSIELDILIFEMSKNGKNPATFKVDVQFENNKAPEMIDEIIIEEQKHINENKQAEQQRQDNLPKHFQDKSYIEQFNKQLQEIEKKKDKVIQYQIFGSLLLVSCGYQIKYGNLALQQNSGKKGKQESKLKDLDCRFEDYIEILRMIETKNENIIQIVALDNKNNIIIVLTWDFNQNIEHSMYQVKVNPQDKPENQIARGLSGPLNYFVSDHFLFDLQNNIPFQQATHKIFLDGQQQQKMSSTFTQVCKVYSDPSRYLCLESPNLLHFPVNRIDILFWMSIINNHKENPELIKNKYNFKLASLQKIYHNKQSLFHYFSHNLKVIDMIHKKFMQAKLNNQLQESEENIPLVMLLPNLNNQTALNIAIQKFRPRCFELMLDMLSNFQQQMLTKMMLDCIPDMIKQNTMLVKKFFDLCTYRSPLMELDLVTRWPIQIPEITFPCHTSVISHDIVEKQISRYVKKDEINRTFQTTANEEKNSKQPFNYDKLPDLKSLASKQSVHKRIYVEAVDFDWIFQEDNAKNLIMLLQNYGQGDIFNSKVLRIFIDIMWEKYQPQLINRVLLPFIIYLYFFVNLSSLKAGPYLDKLLDINQPEVQEYMDKNQWFLFAESAVVFVGIIYFARIELKQIQLKGWRVYFADSWNFFDISFLFICSCYLILVNYEVIIRRFVYNHVFCLRLMAGIACFLMWVKMFYWMRIFSQTAHFVTLISKTLQDIKIFCLMLTIILLAFSNYFFTINNNTYHNDTYANSNDYQDMYGKEPFQYLNSLYQNCYVNSLINIYLLMLGEFYYEDFSSGPNDQCAWIGFVFATFTVLVVFMNLLIAIMGETFHQVKQQTQESLLTEQLGLIEDHIWLVDLKKEFKGKKYIIRLCPDDTGSTDHSNLVEEFHNLSKDIILKNQIMHEKIKQSNIQTEQRMKEMMKQQQIKTTKANRTIQTKSQQSEQLIQNLENVVKQEIKGLSSKIDDIEENLKSQNELISESQDNEIDELKKIVLLQDRQIKQLIALHESK